MQDDKNIILVTADLGFGLWDKIRKDFPDQFYNVGACEQAGMGICVGLSLEGKIPIFYSITPFAIFRPAETIRNYVSHESIPVKIVGSGRDGDYTHDGFSHWAWDDRKFMLTNFENIICRWPEHEPMLKNDVKDLFALDKPFYLNLKR